MKAALLPERGVVKVSGEAARSFINNLVTTDLDRLISGEARFGALLTPQGKIIADFLVTETANGELLFDCPRELAQSFADRLAFYKLRAKVSIANVSEDYAIFAVWDGEPAGQHALVFADPRDPALGWRVLAPADSAPSLATTLGAQISDEPGYEAHRIACGVPRGGADFSYGDAFPHETNMDRLHGVDFDKGCYIGQEVVSRMQHRGTARTRILRVTLDAEPPAPGTPIMAGDKSIGTMGSSTKDSTGQVIGLALIRTDRASDAIDAGWLLSAGSAQVSFVSPDEVRAPAKASA
ncbi:MAG: folate-binding protein [Bradyrhizobiaceae bacterium]|nr:MAG: folate-binding protein [Bradyrhizobiaceae bacterium]